MARTLDLALLRLLRTLAHGPALEHLVARYSRTGEQGALWLCLAATGAALDRDARPVYRRALRVTLAASAAAQAVKLAVRRPRPLVSGLPPLVHTLSARSYPSAHAATSFSAARVLREALPAGPLYAAAAAMALSRPYLGVHYPSDALAGAALGDAVARLVR